MEVTRLEERHGVDGKVEITGLVMVRGWRIRLSVEPFYRTTARGTYTKCGDIPEYARRPAFLAERFYEREMDCPGGLTGTKGKRTVFEDMRRLWKMQGTW